METFDERWARKGRFIDPDTDDAVNREEALSDWEKTRRGEISFKIFADKWLPYLPLGDSSI